MYRLGIGFVTGLVLTAAAVSAHEDATPPLAKVEKVYAAPEPLGELRATYTAAGAGKEQALVVECGVFRGSVPARGLADLPRPDWGGLSVAYSLTSVEHGRWVRRPYVYVVVPLHGPAGRSWEQTWATFHFDADGRLVRRVKRFVPDEATNSIRVVWKEWAVGSGVPAEAVLESGKDE